jgi:hypothetical protein
MKPFKKYIAAILVSLIFPPISYAADGNKLLQQCIAAEKTLNGEGPNEVGGVLGAGICLGLVRGVMFTMRLFPSDEPFKTCFPEAGIKVDQALRIVVSYLEANPEQLHEPDAFLIALALGKAFPCK